ncbi:MAG TPA: DNA internalization-related competence protein ComEC/Rec2 [Myxococcales bacterium]|nr:DNA internalization-related competence protein ComEC/Rec2 [Myxococcales bacterium]HAN31306.1 DNA internalization-related competence protein ComEC/Rec2 [Myxococcales bacterium]
MRGLWLGLVALIWSARWAATSALSGLATLIGAIAIITLVWCLRDEGRDWRTLALSTVLWALIWSAGAAAPLPLDRTLLPKAGAVPPRHRVSLLHAPKQARGTCVTTARWLRTCIQGRCKSQRGRVFVHLPTRLCSLRQGAVLWILGFVHPAPAFGNPGADKSRRDWHRRGIRGRLFARDLDHVSWERGANAELEEPFQSELRNRFKAIFDSPAGGLALALSMGDKSKICPSLRANLLRTGTIHILAVSGAHVGFVLLIAMAALAILLRGWLEVWVLRRCPRIVFQWCLGTIACWCYVWLSGFSSSACRAAWMLSVGLGLRIWGMRTAPLTLVSLAAVAAWCIDLDAPLDSGLNLSLLGVSGVLIAAKFSRGSSYVVRTACISVGASAMTSCMVVPMAGGLCLISPLMNLLVVPWVGFVMVPTSLLASLAVACDVNAHVLVWIARWLEVSYAPLQALSEIDANLWPWLPLGHPASSVVGWSLTFAMALLARPSGRTMSRIVTAGAGLWATILLSQPLGTQLWVFDVGHGDATLIRTRANQTILIDGGGRAQDAGDIGRRALIPSLRALGVHKIDMMILSHAHPDHENGLLAVTQAMDVKYFWFVGPSGTSSEHLALQRLLKRRGTRPWRRDRAVLSEVTLQRLWPPPSGPSPQLSLNNNSLVLEVSVFGRKILLTGDIEQQTEALLLRRQALSKVDLLKVPHHGSLTSSSERFLRQVSPLLSIAGARRWGAIALPHPTIAARYQRLGLRLWVTEDGFVHGRIWPDGRLQVRQGSRAVLLGKANHNKSQSPHSSALVQTPTRSPGAW